MGGPHRSLSKIVRREKLWTFRSRLDYQPLCEKEARAPPPSKERKMEPTSKTKIKQKQWFFLIVKGCWEKRVKALENKQNIKRTSFILESTTVRGKLVRPQKPQISRLNYLVRFRFAIFLNSTDIEYQDYCKKLYCIWITKQTVINKDNWSICGSVRVTGMHIILPWVTIFGADHFR